jgi:hypothetical protein
MMPDDQPTPTRRIAADDEHGVGPELHRFLDRLFDLSGVDLSG